VVERIQKFSEAPLVVCEKCGGKLERVISPPAIQFKGSGFYVNDYARKSSGEPASKPESSKSDGASTGDTKKTSEPTKTETKT
jgi:putative FmdB family regulatory protein